MTMFGWRKVDISTRNALAIDVGRGRFRALLASRHRGGLRVKRVLSQRLPDGLGSEDAKAVGAWAGGQLAAAGFPKTEATIAIAREHVVLKRITLPTTDQHELPEMTRLALRRDLPFDADTAVIDFVIVDRTERATTVLAVAVPHTVLTFARQMAKAAGLDVQRISLRSMGSAALLSSLARREGTNAGAILAVDITPDAVEFGVVADGAIRFSRAAQLPGLDDSAAIADAVVTETRRTWMSYRIVESAEAEDDVCRAVVMGSRRLIEQAAGSIGDILKVKTEVLHEHPLVESHSQDLDGLWPLAGLLLEPGLGVESIDFLRPRKAPDIAARRRQRALAGLGMAVVLIFGAWTAARMNLANLRETEAQLTEQRSTLRPQHTRYWRDRYKLTHLQQWESVGADWLEHLAYIVDITPPPDRLVLDSWSGSLALGGVKFDRKSKRFSTQPQIKIALEGEAADRATADTFRGALVGTQAYQISTAGPDTERGRRLSYAFNYHLRTTAASPRGEEAPQQPTVEGDDEPAPAEPRTAARKGTE